MNRKNYVFLVLVIIMGVTCTSTKDEKSNINKLLGKWISYKVTTEDGGDGSEITLDGKPFDKSLMIDFISDEQIEIEFSKFNRGKIGYRLRDSLIDINHYKFKIVFFEKDKMTLKSNGPFGILYYMKRATSSKE